MNTPARVPPLCRVLTRQNMVHNHVSLFFLDAPVVSGLLQSLVNSLMAQDVHHLDLLIGIYFRFIHLPAFLSIAFSST